MKKHIILAVVAVAVVSASCRKDRTCTCNYTSTDQHTANSTTTTTSYSGSSKTTWTKVHKKNARQQCVNNTETYTTTQGSGNFASTDAWTNETSGCSLK